MRKYLTTAVIICIVFLGLTACGKRVPEVEQTEYPESDNHNDNTEESMQSETLKSRSNYTYVSLC